MSNADSSERITHEIVTTWADGDCKMIKTSSDISVIYPPTGTADYASDHFGVYAYDDHTDIIPMTEDGHVFGACVTRVPEVSHERAIEEFMDNNQDRHVRIVGYDDEPIVMTDGGVPAFVDPNAEITVCHFCGQTWEPSVVDGFDLSTEDEYNPKMVPVCPEHAGGCR